MIDSILNLIFYQFVIMAALLIVFFVFTALHDIITAHFIRLLLGVAALGALVYLIIKAVQMLASLSILDIFLALCALGLLVGLTLTKTSDGRIFWALSGILLLIATIIVYAF